MSSSWDKSSSLVWWLWFVLMFWVFFWAFYYTGLSHSYQEDEVDVVVPNTVSISEYSNQMALEKPGTIASTQDILVTAQANWKVSKISAKEWDEVKWGQTIVSLSDTIASYKLQADRAKNALDRALLTKQQTKLSLDQQIDAANNAYQSAKQAFEYAQKMSDISVRQAGVWLAQAELWLTQADSSFDTLRNSFQWTKSLILSFMREVLDASDALLGVTPYYDNLLWAEESYIWAEDIHQKQDAKKALLSLYELRDKIDALPDSPETADDLLADTELLYEWFQKSLDMAGKMIDVMKNSVSQEYTFSRATIDWNIKYFQLLQVGTFAKAQQITSTVVQYKDQVKSSLSWEGTLWQESANLAQENANLVYENTKAQTENSVFNAEIALKNAKLNLDTLTQNRDVQLWLIDNAIVDSRIAYETALTQYNKLQVRSPVSWVIGSILVSEGQEIWVGTQIFKVSGTKKQQIEVYITADEYKYIQKDKPVEITYQDQLLTGVIDAISTIADRTNLFKATVQMDTDIQLLWDVAKVKFPIQVAENTLLPLDQVKVLNENEWEITIWDWESKKQYPIKIRKTRWDFVELQEALPSNLKLVIK